MRNVLVFLLICFVEIVYCRDFYFGMFERNDFLVAADELYKPRMPGRITYAKYGKLFKCPITYFRVVDRLGSNANPRVEIIRGGIMKKFIVVRLSVYNRPISVNIYVGCHNKNNKHVTYKRRTTKKPTTAATEEDASKEEEETVDKETEAATKQEEATDADAETTQQEDNSTKADEAEESTIGEGEQVTKTDEAENPKAEGDETPKPEGEDETPKPEGGDEEPQPEKKK
ncbi:uncharacterized protein LOC128674241 isoform X2 [Plodia interpunctella]|uniref:uncharacterized protein LOC128674241 isoform X2 n=1 Tax=Plodia interpunctella TaxID=58824 RepID=UPI00236888AE|nr:uncharacterized protein LOC128674241 isoform X2 [Plodia interpunctella]